MYRALQRAHEGAAARRYWTFASLKRPQPEWGALVVEPSRGLRRERNRPRDGLAVGAMARWWGQAGARHALIGRRGESGRSLSVRALALGRCLDQFGHRRGHGAAASKRSTAWIAAAVASGERQSPVCGRVAAQSKTTGRPIRRARLLGSGACRSPAPVSTRVVVANPNRSVTAALPWQGGLRPRMSWVRVDPRWRLP
jgi:hypothetical protein